MDLYKQLVFYSHLFDYEKSKKSNPTLNFDETSKKKFEKLRNVVDGYIDLRGLFSKIKNKID
ncbi:11263_t:CDS:2 [Entrophospora sp. SA101]|nr:11263_t:CDS:2 [Entrophospora sp. SA101]